MPEIPQPRGDNPTESEIWIQSLANLGKRLITAPAKIEEQTPAGERP